MNQSARAIAALVAACWTGAALAQDTLEMPPRTPGLWELRMTMDGDATPPITMKQCIDPETDRMMSALGTDIGKEMCSRQDIRREGSTITVDSTCRIGQGTTTSRSVITGSFETAYSVRVVSKTEGLSMMGVSADGETRMTVEARWAGACQAGQKPGDMILPGGMIMNIRDMQNLRAKKASE